MDDRQFEDMQRRGVIEFVDPEEDRKRKTWQWSIAVAVGFGCFFLALISGMNVLVAAAIGLIGLAGAIAVTEPDKPKDPFEI